MKRKLRDDILWDDNNKTLDNRNSSKEKIKPLKEVPNKIFIVSLFKTESNDKILELDE